jgi:hypothetical protein
MAFITGRGNGGGNGRNQAPLTTKTNGRRWCQMDFGRGRDSARSWRVGCSASGPAGRVGSVVWRVATSGFGAVAAWRSVQAQGRVGRRARLGRGAGMRRARGFALVGSWGARSAAVGSAGCLHARVGRQRGRERGGRREGGREMLGREREQRREREHRGRRRLLAGRSQACAHIGFGRWALVGRLG